MSYVVTQQWLGSKGVAGTVTAIAPLPGFTNISYIHVTGVNFYNGIAPYNRRILPGDGAIITGSGAGNNGTYLVVDVPDQEVLIVRANLAAEGAVPGLELTTQDHVVTITDEATITWATIMAAVNERAIVDIFPIAGSTGGTVYSFVRFALDEVFIHTPGAVDSNWNSTAEIALEIATNNSTWSIKNSIGDLAQIYLNLGSLASSNRRSYYEGSIWHWPARTAITGSITANMYGSCGLRSGTATMDLFGDSKIYGCFFLGGFGTTSGWSSVGTEFQDVITAPGSSAPPFLLDTVSYADNVCVGHAAQQATLFASGTTLLQKAAFSDSYPSIPLGVALLTAELRDFQEDYDLANIATILVPGAAVKSYTYNPVVVDNWNSPISGATVYIAQIDDSVPGVETPVSGSPFTTDSNGQLNSGSGVVLTMQDTVATGVYDTYSYHIQIVAPSFQMYDAIVKLIQPVESRLSLRLYEPALEGEEPTL